ncbi:hypothetical protein HDV57DRAFT_411620 [Trichoderma longibrachiatum]
MEMMVQGIPVIAAPDDFLPPPSPPSPRLLFFLRYPPKTPVYRTRTQTMQQNKGKGRQDPNLSKPNPPPYHSVRSSEAATSCLAACNSQWEKGEEQTGWMNERRRDADPRQTHGVLYELCRAANPVPNAAGRAMRMLRYLRVLLYLLLVPWQGKAVQPRAAM